MRPCGRSAWIWAWAAKGDLRPTAAVATCTHELRHASPIHSTLFHTMLPMSFEIALAPIHLSRCPVWYRGLFHLLPSHCRPLSVFCQQPRFSHWHRSLGNGPWRVCACAHDPVLDRPGRPLLDLENLGYHDSCCLVRSHLLSVSILIMVFAFVYFSSLPPNAQPLSLLVW